MPDFVLPAVLTHDVSARYATSLGLAAKSGKSGVAEIITADAAALTTFDSSALAVLLQCRRQALAIGKKFVVLNMPPRLQQLATLYGVQALFAP